MKKFIKFHLIVCMAFSAVVGSVYAAEGTTSSTDVGVLGGLAFVGNGNGTKLNLGAQFNYKFMPPFGVGLYYDYVGLGSVQIPGSTVNYSNYLMHLLARVNYDLSSQLSGLSAGIDVGPQFFTTNLPGASNSTDLTYGIHGVYDVPVSTNFSIGPEASLFLTTMNQGATIVNVVAVAKYLF